MSKIVMSSAFAVWPLMLHRAWQGGAGLVSAILIANFATLSDQGWYYSFLSLASIASLLDLGLSVTLVQVAARNAADTNSVSANAGLVRTFLLYYAAAAACFVLLSGLLGCFAFSNSSFSGDTEWVAPWVALNGVIAANLLLTPVFAVEEGAGRQSRVYWVRFLQSVFGAFATWAALIVTGPLWATLAAPACALVVGLAWLWTERHSALMRAVRASRGAHRVADVWPLQSRVAVSWISGYLLVQIAPPLLFRLHGPEDAGRMGLSLAFANMVGILAQSAIAARTPSMTRYAHQKRWPDFDRTFRDALVGSLIVFAGLAIPLAFLRALGENSPYAERLLDPFSFSLLLCAVLANHVCGALASHLRSFHKEPLVWIVLAAALSSVALTLAIAPHYGARGVTASYFAVQMALLPAAFVVWRGQNRLLRR